MTFWEFFKLRPNDPDPRRANFARIHSRLAGLLGIVVGAVVAALFAGPIIAALALGVGAAAAAYFAMLGIGYAVFRRGERDTTSEPTL